MRNPSIAHVLSETPVPRGARINERSPAPDTLGASEASRERPSVARRVTRRRRPRRLAPYLFLLLPLVLLVVFTYVPIANMVSYSLVEWDGLSKTRQFVGLDNFVEIFTRPQLFGVFWVSLYYLAGSFVQMGMALYLATILSFKTQFRSFFKGVIFFPYLINGVAIAFTFLYFFRRDGVLDHLLATFGIGDTPLWLGDRELVNISLTGVSVWRYLGLNFVLFLGAIQSIPSETLEAAEIDGAGRWQQFRHLIVPSIKPVISLSFILAIAGSLSAFEIPYVMLARGERVRHVRDPDRSSTAFLNQKFGLASAMAVVLLVLILVVTWLQRRFVPEEQAELI